MLTAAKLNTIEVLDPKALIDSVISQDEFVLVNDVLKGYKNLKYIFVSSRESNDFILKITELLLTASNKSVLNKADSSLLLELFIIQHSLFNISGYHMMFYHIM